MAQVKLNSGEIKDFLGHIIENNRYLQKQGKIPVAVEVIGEAGLGKTTVIMDVAKEHNLECIKLNMSMLDELADLIGFPVRQFQLCKQDASKPTIIKQTVFETQIKEVEKKLPTGQIIKVKQKVEVPVEKEVESTLTDDCIWVDEHAVEQYTSRGYGFTGQKRMTYCPPEWIANKTAGVILLLDDFSRAQERFLQATMELISRQEYVSWSLPADSHIILSSNPDNGAYLVNSLDSAQKTRYISIEMTWDAEKWAEWAEEQGIDSRC